MTTTGHVRFRGENVGKPNGKTIPNPVLSNIISRIDLYYSFRSVLALNKFKKWISSSIFYTIESSFLTHLVSIIHGAV